MARHAVEAASRAAAAVPRRAVRLARRSGRAVERRLVGAVGVLAYHRVADPAHDPWDLSVSPLRFGDHLAVLRELGTIEPLDAVLDASAWTRCRRRRPTFAITFDDGYVDNLTKALPLLERHDAPATVFVPTGMVDRPSFWWDVLTDLVLDTSDLARAAPSGGRPRTSWHRPPAQLTATAGSCWTPSIRPSSGCRRPRPQQSCRRWPSWRASPSRTRRAGR